MSTSRVLDVSGLHTLGVKRFDGLRVEVSVLAKTEAQILRGDVREHEIEVALGNPGRERDLVGTYYAAVFLASAHMRDTLTRLSIGGWTWLRVPDSLGLSQPYGILAVTGRSGPAYGHGGLDAPVIPALGSFLDPKEWDGSDIFVASNNNTIFVTRRAADEIRVQQLSNLDLRLSAFEELPGS